MTNRNIFYNLWIEKNQNITTLSLNMVTKYYRRLRDSNRNIVEKLNLIQTINNIFGIQHSCQGYRFVEEELCPRIYPEIYPLLSDLELYFNATSNAEKLTLNISNRLEKVYKTWCGITWKKDPKQFRINGKRERCYTVEMSDNKLLWDALSPWREDSPKSSNASTPIVQYPSTEHVVPNNNSLFTLEIISNPIVSVM